MYKYLSTYKLQYYVRQVYKEVNENHLKNGVQGVIYINITIVIDAHHYTFSLAVRRSTGTGRPFLSVAAAVADGACA